MTCWTAGIACTPSSSRAMRYALRRWPQIPTAVGAQAGEGSPGCAFTANPVSRAAIDLAATVRTAVEMLPPRPGRRGPGSERTWDGETWYVNCLLTTMAEGAAKSVTLSPKAAVPLLLPLAGANEGLRDWIRSLALSYERLSAAEVCAIIAVSAKVKAMMVGERGELWTLLVPPEGPLQPIPHRLLVECVEGNQGEPALRLTLVPASPPPGD
jgi:hypothetical protein